MLSLIYFHIFYQIWSLRFGKIIYKNLSATYMGYRVKFKVLQ